MIFIETSIFTEDVKTLLTDDEYQRFQLYLAAPTAGDVISETGGLRKVRWKLSDRGKSGGVHVIYFHVSAASQVRLLLIYCKGVKDDLSKEEKKEASGNHQRVAMMDKKLFDRLLQSTTQMDEIIQGERPASREFHVDAAQVKAIRETTGLSQPAFAKAIGVALGTLRNWEQGRRDPEGPARALLRAIHNDPENVIAALSQ